MQGFTSARFQSVSTPCCGSRRLLTDSRASAGLPNIKEVSTHRTHATAKQTEIRGKQILRRSGGPSSFPSSEGSALDEEAMSSSRNSEREGEDTAIGKADESADPGSGGDGFDPSACDRLIAYVGALHWSFVMWRE